MDRVRDALCSVCCFARFSVDGEVFRLLLGSTDALRACVEHSLFVKEEALVGCFDNFEDQVTSLQLLCPF